MSTAGRSPPTIWTRSPGQARRGRITPACRETLRHWLERFAGCDDTTFAGGGLHGVAVRGRGAAAGGGHRAAGRTGRERGTGAAPSAAPRPARPTPGTCAPWWPRAGCRCPWIPPEQVSELRALRQASPAARRWPGNCTGPGRWSRRSSGRSDRLEDRLPGLVPPGVLLIRFHAGRDRVRPADPLELRGDLLVIQVGIVTAIAADELIRVGVAAFRPAADEAGRLAPEHQRPVLPRRTMDHHARPFSMTSLDFRSCAARGPPPRAVRPETMVPVSMAPTCMHSRPPWGGANSQAALAHRAGPARMRRQIELGAKDAACLATLAMVAGARRGRVS